MWEVPVFDNLDSPSSSHCRPVLLFAIVLGELIPEPLGTAGEAP